MNNATHQTDNTVIVYNETTKEVYRDKQKIIKPKSYSNYNTDKYDNYAAKLKQKIQRKEGEREAGET